MSAPDKKRWAKATRARDKLDQLIGSHPDVSLIDIGEDATEGSDMLVLRVHVRSSVSTISVPSVLDDIPVHVIPGDYTPEA